MKVRLRKLEGEAFLRNEIGRSRQDLAVRSLGSRASPASAQNTAVDEGYKDATQKCDMFGRDVTGESEDAKTPL